MTWATDGNVAAWVKQGFGEQVRCREDPQIGQGKLAQYYDATQVDLYLHHILVLREGASGRVPDVAAHAGKHD